MAFVPPIFLALYAGGTLAYGLWLVTPKPLLTIFGKIGVGSAFALHSLYLIFRLTATGVAFDSALRFGVFAWMLILAFLLITAKKSMPVLGAMIPPVAFLMSLSLLKHPESPSSLPPLLFSAWLPVHILGAFLGEALFAFSAVVALLYLLQENQLKSRRPGFWLARLPALESLDHLLGRILKWGFLCLTLGLLAGAVWAHTAKQINWVADPKQIWAVITWLLYALMIHLRLQMGVSGKRGAWLAIFGALLVIFTFFGTNLIYGNSHHFWAVMS